MQSRREFLGTGLAAVALGLSPRGLRLAAAQPPSPQSGALPFRQTPPFNDIPLNPQSVMVDGFPFDPVWRGDDFPTWNQIPFHRGENIFPGGQPPAPTETVPLAIIGGGLSGLSTAYMLREHRPVVFELHQRFGGNSQGEVWNGINYSLGGAYFMTPDEGTFLEHFYHELGLDHAHRLDDANGDAELQGAVLRDFWNNAAIPPEDRPAFERYAALVNTMANDTYPDIPLVEGENNQWILDLDRKTLKEDITERLGLPVPTLLASAIQSYCYSSFDAGWEELSAACGWNFVAAEEFGRWVCKGGNTHVVQKLWDRLSHLEPPGPPSAPGRLLRAGCKVVDVRLHGSNHVQITYRDAAGGWRSILAKKAVLACSKHIAKRLVWDIQTLDAAKLAAMWQIETRSYVVANVLLTRPMTHDVYDLFLLGNGQLPDNAWGAHLWWHTADVVDGAFGDPHGHPHASVLTIYWPLPSFDSRVRIAGDQSWQLHANRLTPQLREILGFYGFQPADVRQIRMARWGHAMPIPRPSMIADGVTELLRRPIGDRIYFVNQDNWLLPAFETCLLEARNYSPAIARGL